MINKKDNIMVEQRLECLDLGRLSTDCMYGINIYRNINTN